MNKIYYNKYTITIPQSKFYVEKSYIPNTKSLFVYYNGLLLASGDDYIEVDEHTVELSFEAQRGDVIIISPLAVGSIRSNTTKLNTHIKFDEFIIKTRQSEFKLKNKYVPNTNSLSVYVNGMLLESARYIEVDSETVRILARLEVDDVVIISPTILVSDNIFVLKSGLLNKEKWHKYDEFIIEKEEREFKLSAPYEPGTNSIKVFFNGVLLDEANYIEKSPTTVALKFFPEPKDIIVVMPAIDMEANINRVNEDIIGSKASSMFYRYGTVQTLMPNQKYTLSLTMSGEKKEFTFTSLYDPFYSTGKLIRMDLPNILEDVDDDRLNFIIWQNSKLVEDLYEDELTDPDKKPYIKGWVRYKTEIDLINSIYIDIASRAGSSQKTLGNMQVSESVKIPYLDEMIKLINKKFHAEEVKLSGRRSVGLAIRKADSTSYPIAVERNSF